jgi:phenylalanine-4-hydroxylase
MKTLFNDFNNPQVAKLPDHLRQFVVDQDYSNYTALDHALWRYVMRKNISYLKNVADVSYLDGLEKTGITIDAIPNIKDMNDILGEIGWGCVCVDGFLPPSSFMEFQAYKVLVIAADIRQIEHIEYTPAPDIIHEAAGHAPIIADPMYAEYLRLFGEIGSKAISSSKDFELYEAIRHLSIVKEDPNTEANEIKEAELEISRIQQNMGEPSEMAKIRNLHWWTV